MDGGEQAKGNRQPPRHFHSLALRADRAMARGADADAAHSAAPLLLDGRRRACFSDSCPGCKLDRRNAEREGVPYLEFFYIWLAVLCSSLPIQSLFPFLYFMIRDFNVAKQEEDIGFYAGFVGSSYMVGRALSSVIWGFVADKYGRKPVIMISIISVIVFNTLFGLSSTYLMAITTRTLLGLLCGLLGPIKAYASEVSRKEHQALGLSLISSSRGIGLIIGPAIGGFLAQPAEKYPSIFSNNSLFGRFPYFLPCLCISVIALAAFIACLWLPETLHTHCGNIDQTTLVEDVEEAHVLEFKKSETALLVEKQNPQKNLFKNWPLMSAILVYCVFSLQEMAYAEIFPIWAESNKGFGGLSFSSEDVGAVLTITGACLLVYQILVYPKFAKYIGPVMSIRLSAILTIPLLSSYPFMTRLSGPILKLVVNCASFWKNVFSVTTITGFNILQNNAVSQEQRGAANGISVTAMSLFKAVAPAAGGAIFSLAQRRQKADILPGDHLVFFLLNVVGFFGILLTFRPFLVPPHDT